MSAPAVDGPTLVRVAATVDLPGLRPPVLRVATAEGLSDHLAFRHLYRNLYAFNLRWDRVRELAVAVEPLWPEVRRDLEAFAAFLDAAASP